MEGTYFEILEMTHIILGEHAEIYDKNHHFCKDKISKMSINHQPIYIDSDIYIERDSETKGHYWTVHS